MVPTRYIFVGVTIAVLALTSRGTLAEADIASEDSLASAFLAQCLHMQDCVRERMATGGTMDPALVQMIEAGMTGQCEAQLQKISQYEASPHTQKLKDCYQAMTALSCAEHAAQPSVPACEQ
ncbi:MAG: hypothetical protein P8J17_13110 [Halioglobus sp.]|nr:hypothetical protein [Halioglobus sp.]